MRLAAGCQVARPRATTWECAMPVPRNWCWDPVLRLNVSLELNRDTSLWPLDREGDGGGLAGATRARRLARAEIAHSF